MNIFYLDENPDKCAEAHFDKHVVKMILESAQLLSTAHRVLDGEQYIELNRAGARIKRWKLDNPEMENNLYKATHYNHPSALWARGSHENYDWLVELWLALMKEYTYRYDKTHACIKLTPYLMQLPRKINYAPFTPVVPAMDREFIVPNNSIESYRNYYRQSKMHLMAYTRREAPEWLI